MHRPVVRRHAVASIALLTVLSTPIDSFGQDGSGGPRAVPVEPIRDFEVVAKGDVLHHAFEIRNAGDATLELTDVRPACPCTLVEFDKEIAPGEVGQVRSATETASFAGPITKSIAVFTNDSENPKLQLVVKAEVTAFIGAQPGFARYTYVQGEELAPIPQLIWSQEVANGSESVHLERKIKKRGIRRFLEDRKGGC